MNWNHRVINVGTDAEPMYEFCEAFYDDGSTEPHSYSAAFMCSETKEGLIELTDRLRAAIDKPFLKASDFEQHEEDASTTTTITLNNDQAAVVFDANGSHELHLPAGSEDYEVNDGTYRAALCAVMLNDPMMLAKAALAMRTLTLAQLKKE